MEKHNKPLTDSDIKILKDARKILRKIQKKYDEWEDKIYNLEGEKFFTECKNFEKWIDELYDVVKIDFDDKAFIEY